jgi:signal transduction histidine kinase
MERPFLTAKGRPIWVRSFGKVEHEQGVPVRLIGALQDITEHRQSRVDLLHEQVLRAETERHAQDLNRVLHERNEMLDVLAHEVRQPLNNASAALQSAAAALSEVGEPVASQRLTRAQAVMGQVLASIDNTLAVASLLARPEPIHREDSDIDTVLAMAIADVPASERIRVQTERSTDTRTASMDMSLMRLALRNLLANALRYSPAGLPVVIRVSDSDDPLAMVIDVADSGPGIPADRVPTLFERGVRGAHSGAASGGGMGLGLYIVRRVMELHGGQALLVRNGPDGVTVRLVIQPLADD